MMDVTTQIQEAVNKISNGRLDAMLNRWVIDCDYPTYQAYGKLIRKYPEAFSIFGITAEDQFVHLFSYLDHLVKNDKKNIWDGP